MLRNRLLDALPADERRRLSRLLHREWCDLKQPLIRPDEVIENVYFPITAVVSLLTLLRDGSGIEIATVGSEGLVGAPVFLGASAPSSLDLAQVQVPGEVLRIDAEAFRREVQGRRLHEVVERYVQAYLRQVAQEVACNGLHKAEERCSRWILLIHDRVGSDEFPLTQEFLSQLLGGALATTAVGELQRAGLVRFSRGRVSILDRHGLEDASCECYDIVRDEFDRLLGEAGSP